MDNAQLVPPKGPEVTMGYSKASWPHRLCPQEGLGQGIPTYAAHEDRLIPVIPKREESRSIFGVLTCDKSRIMGPPTRFHLFDFGPETNVGPSLC